VFKDDETRVLGASEPLGHANVNFVHRSSTFLVETPVVGVLIP